MARFGSFDEYETFERIPRRKRKGTIDLTDKVCEKLAMAQAQRSLGGCRKISFYNKAGRTCNGALQFQCARRVKSSASQYVPLPQVWPMAPDKHVQIRVRETAGDPYAA